MSFIKKIKVHEEAVVRLLMSPNLVEKGLIPVGEKLGRSIEANIPNSSVSVQPEPGRSKRAVVQVIVNDYALWQEARDGSVASAVNQARS